MARSVSSIWTNGSIDNASQRNEDAARAVDFRSDETMTTDSPTKILVADDDLEILALVARRLSALPAEVVEASDLSLIHI